MLMNIIKKFKFTLTVGLLLGLFLSGFNAGAAEETVKVPVMDKLVPVDAFEMHTLELSQQHFEPDEIATKETFEIPVMDDTVTVDAFEMHTLELSQQHFKKCTEDRECKALCANMYNNVREKIV